MTGRNSYAGVDPYLVSLVRVRTHQLIGRFGFTETDRLDLQQELMLELLRKMKRFDPARGKKTTYAARIVDRAIKDLLRLRVAQRRNWRLCRTSLDDGFQADVEDAPALMMDSVRCAGLAGLESLDGGDSELLALRIDLERVLETLPAELRAICERLKEVSLAVLARETGVPRSTLFYKRKQIRRAFAEAGLEIYLKKSPTD